ncbi:hypothetical protein F511_43662 [Dorcoceras hygrometricum]|uniref:Uncharacterized protein n=1 Tax=Dorcoceras hygrometricum TaxID=472368 RepID=A0A2Z7B4S4_9LAMI|nr:hypothetical protein F511_43662 [Dorcoceras hygrometricum]
MHMMFDVSPCWRLGAWLRPDSQRIWHFKSTLEGLTNLPRTESPQQGDRNKSDQGKRRRAGLRGGARAAAVRCCGEGGGGGQLGG